MRISFDMTILDESFSTDMAWDPTKIKAMYMSSDRDLKRFGSDPAARYRKQQWLLPGDLSNNGGSMGPYSNLYADTASALAPTLTLSVDKIYLSYHFSFEV